MTQPPSRIVPVVPMPRHRAVAWSCADRAATARRLAALGITITEASDARELAGRPRLSESSAEQRHFAPLWFMGTTGRSWLAKARAERAFWAEALAALHPETVAQARRLLGIRRASPSALRLVEMPAIYAQARVLEIAAEAA